MIAPLTRLTCAPWRLVLFGTCALTMACSAAHAEVVAFERSTTGQPTFNRPIADLSGLSAVGTATPYDVQGFTVSQSGTYSFVANGAFDNFFFLYGGAFDPTAPLSNGLAGNDDTGGLGIAGVEFDLVAGEQYFAVTTSFGNADSGAYGLSVAGPGDITGLTSNTASSQVAILAGDTGGSPTFNRSLADFSAFSPNGTDVAYDLVEFTVGASGSYGLTTLADFDSFVFLYSGFDVSAPLTNGLGANDDLISLGSSGLSADLLAGVTYQAVVTGFANGDFGDYVLTLAGPSDIRFVGAGGGVVPEPAAWALMILGFAGVGAMARTRRTKSAQ